MAIEAKSEIDELVEQIEELKRKVALLRRSQPRVAVENYSFAGQEGQPVDLASLFSGHDDLLVVHNMGRSCTYCTLWADGFNGFVAHLENRGGFVVISGDDPSVQKEFADSRGWKFKMVSDPNARFTRDMGYLTENNERWPGVSGFRRDPDGSIYRVATAVLGPGDDFCPIWHMFDLLQDGAIGWEPKYKYSTG